MTPVRLEPAALLSRVKHSTTEPLRSLKKEKRNGLVGDKNRGLGGRTEGKKEKTKGYWGLKTEGGEGQPKEKRENEWISRGKNRGRVGQPKGKKRKRMD